VKPRRFFGSRYRTVWRWGESTAPFANKGPNSAAASLPVATGVGAAAMVTGFAAGAAAAAAARTSASPLALSSFSVLSSLPEVERGCEALHPSR
jgi:F0F1-type ATP synthase membrane subunit c/vacuolar-type H+-ATPase subunit K